MVFKLPNVPDTAYLDQAEPDAGDFAALAERSTGVLTGCAVTAQGTPALAADVAAGTVVVGGVPVTVTSGTVTFIGGEASARFDLVVVDNTGAKLVIKGTASTNPEYPVFNPATVCWLAAVYVRQSTTTIQVTDVIDKRVTLAATFTRVYTDTTTTAISLTDSASKVFSIKSNGDHAWASNVLRRTADAAMEFATSLVVKAADVTQSLLILRARPTNPASHHVLEVQQSDNTVLASIAGDGRVSAVNFRGVSGSPEGVEVGNKGDVRIDITFSNPNTAFYIKSTNGGNTGWVSLAKYDTTTSALPPGTAYAWLGNPATPPAGSVYMNGQFFSATDPTYAALLGVLGYRYGGTLNVNFAVPDWRGKSVMGTGGVLGLTLDDVVGRSDGLMTLVEANLPAHNHDIIDNGHVHPAPGRAYLYNPPSQPTTTSPYPSWMFPVEHDIPSSNRPPTLPYMDIEDPGFNATQGRAPTGIVIENAGEGAAFSTLDPSGVANWMIKL